MLTTLTVRRKKVLLLLILVVVALSVALLFSFLFANRKPQKSFEGNVIVVGGGFAGIGAARALHDAGVSVTVLEAKNYLGGRVRTVRLLQNGTGIPAEVGATWLDGKSGANPVARVVEAFRVDALRYDDWTISGSGDTSGAVAFDAIDSVTFPMDEMRRYTRDFLRQSTLRRLRRQLPADASMRDGADLYIRTKDLDGVHARRARFAIEQNLAALVYSGSAAVTSLRYFWEDEDFSGGSYVFPYGYSTLIEKMAEPLTIHLEKPVDHIKYDDEGVVVESGSHSYYASKVIVTVPLGVLKAGTITFDPALPHSKRKAIERVGFGTLEKVILVFESKFWPDKGLLYVGKNLGEIPAFFDFSFVYGIPTLVAWHGGLSSTETLRSMTDNEVVENCLSKLAEALKVTVPWPLDFLVSRWQEDPFVLGSYAFPAIGSSPNDMDQLAEPVGNTLLFAGEATDRMYYGQTHGALLSGLREATRIEPISNLDRIGT